MKHFTAVLALMTILSISSPGFAVNAAVDRTSLQMEPWTVSDRFHFLRTALNSAGHTLTSLRGELSLAALTDYDLLITGTLAAPYAASEVTALQDFVAVGGSVLVIHDGGYPSDTCTPSMNEFLAPYGMELASESTFGTGLLVEGFVDHCLTAGVSSLGLDYVRMLTNVSAPAEDLTLTDLQVLAVYEDESGGMVIVLPDDSLWVDPGTYSADYSIFDLDNLSMLLNIFDCLGGAVAVESVTWGAVKGLYR